MADFAPNRVNRSIVGRVNEMTFPAPFDITATGGESNMGFVAQVLTDDSKILYQTRGVIPWAIVLDLEKDIWAMLAERIEYELVDYVLHGPDNEETFTLPATAEWDVLLKALGVLSLELRGHLICQKHHHVIREDGEHTR